ncbi:MAG: translation initiation factor IF-3 [Candidatus Lloydbacteria bacterium]|nr:translation initiation factor IF-3 [Candidatus Lloydbacteria bacterium]
MINWLYSLPLKIRTRINNQIRASQVRVIDSTGNNLGVLPIKDALEKARAEQLDLIEISPNALPPIARIMDYGKYQYEQKKKQKEQHAKARTVEVKNIQIKIGTGEHDLALKAKRANEFLKEGHRVKIELFLSGRAKYLEQPFLKERLDRVLHLIAEEYSIAEPAKRVPKGLAMILEKKRK